MNNGLTGKELKDFTEIVIKANEEQLDLMYEFINTNKRFRANKQTLDIMKKNLLLNK